MFGPDQCVIEFLDIRVDECKAHLSRNVVHEWKEGVECDGGLTLPEDTQVECSEYDVPMQYMQQALFSGRTMSHEAPELFAIHPHDSVALSVLSGWVT